jgi:hypothetical protein
MPHAAQKTHIPRKIIDLDQIRSTQIFLSSLTRRPANNLSMPRGQQIDLL